MTISDIDVSGALERAKKIAVADKNLPSAVRSVLELLVLIIELLLQRLNVNSRNSSVPPSQDPHRSRGRVPRPGGHRDFLRNAGLQTLANHLGVDFKNIIHFGDSARAVDNDVVVKSIIPEATMIMVTDSNETLGADYGCDRSYGLIRMLESIAHIYH